MTTPRRNTPSSPHARVGSSSAKRASTPQTKAVPSPGQRPTHVDLNPQPPEADAPPAKRPSSARLKAQEPPPKQPSGRVPTQGGKRPPSSATNRPGSSAANR